MGKKRKEKLPPKEGGFAFIIIVLAFFLILSGVLGYLAYDFNDKLEAATAAKVEAEKAAAEAKKLTVLEQDRIALYKLFVGMGSKDESDRVNNSQNKAALQEDHNKLMAFVADQVNTVSKNEAKTIREVAGAAGGEFKIAPSDAVSWPWPATGNLPDKPGPKPLVDRLVQLMAEKETAYRIYSQQINRNQALKAELDAAKAAYEGEKTKLQAVVAKIPVDAREREDARDKEVALRLKEFADALKLYRLNKGELAQKDKDIGDLQEKARELIAQVKDISEQLSAKNAEKEDLFPYDTPKGVITVVRQNKVEIDLGSADNVKPGLTFNVMPLEVKEKGIAARTRRIRVGDQEVAKVVPKGIIEVTEVLGPHLSTAIIKEEEDPYRDPIMKTDLLFNAAWRKGQPDHIVLVGIFDIDADGTDDIRTVDRELSRMGIVVDGYFDLIERKWVRGGPSQKTNYVVEGDYPRITTNDALLQLKTDVSNAISFARKEAVDKGAKAVRHRDFFPRIGYKARYDASDDRINQAAAKYLKAPGEAAPMPEVPKN